MMQSCIRWSLLIFSLRWKYEGQGTAPINRVMLEEIHSSIYSGVSTGEPLQPDLDL